ncbi:hypothetical protein PIB30_100795, partial [Stylosanthes scabra]|nr:hypothetical protein [Stylosanthes scabra]
DFQQQQQQGFKAITDLITDMKLEILNYFENMKQNQENQFDQMKAIIAQQQEIIANQNREFQALGQKQDQLEKELSEIRRAQVNLAIPTTEHPTTPANNETLMDIARMTYQQREELKQIRKQMREWTMYSSARECYDVWAHQQANPNLVQMPLHDLTKMVYDNLENKRPMFRGALKTDPNPGQVSRPEPMLVTMHNTQEGG